MHEKHLCDINFVDMFGDLESLIAETISILVIAPLVIQTSVENCCRPPMLMGPSSDAYRLHPPTQRSLVGHTIPHVRPSGLSENIAFADP